MALVRPLDGYHGPRYSMMLAHLATGTTEIPNPMSNTPDNCQQFVYFACSALSLTFSQSSRIRTAKQPNIPIRKVQSAFNRLSKYFIDERIFEDYQLKCVRNQFYHVIPGYFRIPGLEFASNNFISLCRMHEGAVVPAHTTYRLGNESYLITSGGVVTFNIPNYVANTSFTWDRINSYVCFNEGACELKRMLDAPIIIVGDRHIAEGDATALRGGEVITFNTMRWAACRLEFSETHIHREERGRLARPIPERDSISKWAHIIESTSPVIAQCRLSMFTICDANTISMLESDYRYAFIDILYKITIIAELLSV